jgi:hypothetical protein
MNYLGRSIPLIGYEDESTAHSALQAGYIQAYYIMPPDYIQNGRAKLVYVEEPGAVAKIAFENLVKERLLSGKPAAVAARASDGISLDVRTADGSRFSAWHC